MLVDGEQVVVPRYARHVLSLARHLNGVTAPGRTSLARLPGICILNTSLETLLPRSALESNVARDKMLLSKETKQMTVLKKGQGWLGGSKGPVHGEYTLNLFQSSS